MAITAHCSSCEYAFDVDAELLGRRICCPSCGDPVLVGASRTARRSSRPSAARRSFQEKTVRARQQRFWAVVWFITGFAAGLTAILTGSLLLSGRNDAAASAEQTASGEQLSERPDLDRDFPAPDSSTATGSTTDVSGRHPKLLLNTAPLDPPVTSWEDVKERLEPCIVRVQAVRNGSVVKSGSGFLLHGAGIIATSFRVVEGADDVRIRFVEADSMTSASVVAEDSRREIVLLRIDAGQIPAGVSPVSLRLSAVDAGSEIAVLGIGNAGEPVLKEGNVLALRSASELAQVRGLFGYAGIWVEHTVAAPDDLNGAPLIGRNGRVLGISLTRRVRDQITGLAITSEEVASLFVQKAASLADARTAADGGQD